MRASLNIKGFFHEHSTVRAKHAARALQRLYRNNGVCICTKPAQFTSTKHLTGSISLLGETFKIKLRTETGSSAHVLHCVKCTYVYRITTYKIKHSQKTKVCQCLRN
uniref:Uncharacterized protein n=1 Tax=Anguilla anguilla TaxID=7936 RepID=A0A0E9WZD5_ANGAN